MFKSQFTIAIRTLWRNRGFSALNIAGLAVGTATCLVIMLFVGNELSFDRFNKKADRMVTVYFQGNIQGERMNEASVMPPVAQTLKADYPEVEEATRLRDGGQPRLQYGDKSFRNDPFAFVDSNFFEVFTLPLLQGDAHTALQSPNSVVVSKAVAAKYFGEEDPMGKLITLKDGSNTAYKVTGLIAGVPRNASFHFDLFASMAGVAEAKEPTWMSSNFFTYLVLRKGTDAKKLEARLPQMVQRYMGPQMARAMGVTLTDFRKQGNDLSFHLEPITKIHLDPDFPNVLGKPGDIKNVYIFGSIAICMLLIACINFMNLSTAGAAKRAREVGVRKVLGSLKTDLVKQFLLESMLLSAIALAAGLLLIQPALPAFNRLSGLELDLHLSDHPLYSAGLLLLFVVVTGFLAGGYPAFYLSSFNPASVLKGTFSAGKKGIGLRSGLVVFQFFVSIVLIVSTTVVFKQLSYLRQTDVGYNKEQVMIIPDAWMLGRNQEGFYQQLRTSPLVAGVSRSGYLPAGRSNNNNFFVAPDQAPDRMVKALRYDVDENYISVLGLRMASGRNFSPQFPTDSGAVILNETAARVLGWGNQAAGHTIYNSDNRGQRHSHPVIGVVKDFNFRSLHERISPLVMALAPDQSTLIAKLKTKDIAALTAALSKSWTAAGAEDAFSYSFLDERFNNTYQTEQKTGAILGLFAGLTIFVACLGLFGLAMFTAQQRTKEIGIRKVLGADVPGILSLLSKDFLKMVLLAFVIASPVAWLIMTKWLQEFAYHTRISWWVFVVAATAAMLIAVVAVSYQSLKAALANPVRSLRTE